MKKIIAVTLALSIVSFSASAAPECDKAGGYGRKIYLLKINGMTLERYRVIEGAPPLPILDIIERAIFTGNVKNENHAALLANTLCNKYYDK